MSEHTCHDMNPPHPYPCRACEVERGEYLAGLASTEGEMFDAVVNWLEHHGDADGEILAMVQSLRKSHEAHPSPAEAAPGIGERIEVLLAEGLRGPAADLLREAAGALRAAVPVEAPPEWQTVEELTNLREAAAPASPSIAPTQGAEEPINTYTPMSWSVLTEDQKYEEYVRVRQIAAQADREQT